MTVESPMILKQKAGDGRREHEPEVGPQIFEREGPLPVLRLGQIREERVVGRVFHALENARDDEDEDRAQPQRDRRAEQKAGDADAVADHDQPFFVDAVGELASDQVGGQHDHAGSHEEIGDLRGRQPDLLAEDHGHHRPDHAAEVRDHPPEG